MQTLVVFAALVAVSVTALSLNQQQPDLKSWMSTLNNLEALSIAQELGNDNEYHLTEDTEEPYVRKARHAGGKGGFLTMSCCGKETLNCDNVKEYVTKCQGAEGENQKPDFKCIGQAAGVSDADGKITDGGKFADTVAEMYDDDDLKAIVKQACPQCVEDANSSHGQEGKHGYKKVAVVSAFFCVRKAVETTCPVDKQINNEKCNKIREHISKKGASSEEN